MAIEVQEADQTPDVNLVFTKADRQDVVPHDNDPVVISVVTAGRRVHRILVDQGSLADMMICSTFNKLQLSPDQLRPYTGCLYGFAGDQVEMRGHIELRMTFTDGTASRTTNIRYLVVNAQSAYNILVPTSPRVSLSTSKVGPRKRGLTSGVGQYLARHVRQKTKEWSDIGHQDVPTCHQAVWRGRTSGLEQKSWATRSGSQTTYQLSVREKPRSRKSMRVEWMTRLGVTQV